MTRNVYIYDSRPDLNFLLNREVVLGGAKSIELEITITGFLFYLIVDKLNYLRAVSQNFFNGKMQMKSVFSNAKKETGKEIMDSKALVKCYGFV